MNEDDEAKCTILGELAVYAAAGVDPDTPTCEICGHGVPARFRLKRHEGRIMRFCALHLLTSVDTILGQARQELGRLLADLEET